MTDTRGWDEKARENAVHCGFNSMAIGVAEAKGIQAVYVNAARWQREQLQSRESIERLANFLFQDDNGESIDQHEKICHDASKCRFRSDYTQFARAAIGALLEQEPRP